ncbi:PAS domain-containing protein [Rhizobium deserti]|uniref:Blue-light-activated histidine kinase n=1 Tax=Rhizobium deserti TaxID=2547961 RepID=A0A4V3ANL9_9HYPH|nr:HWE histidine kinase domain-containing protein [Rhizobium deserti]TDK32132.1 PAS domain-containing protein [Rhizobium deserti]
MNVDDLYRVLRAGHIQAQGIVDTITDPMLVLDESLRIQNASRSFFTTFKVDRDEVIGRLVYELGDGQWDIPDLRLLLQQVLPRSTAVIDFQVEHDFPRIGRRTMLLSARTLSHPDNVGLSMLLTMVDVTEQVRRNVAKDILFGELRHRIKNLLGVVRSIARQTSTKDRSAEEYRQAFLGRFEALVAAQDLAFGEQHSGNLQALIERVLEPYAGDQHAIVVEPGPPLEPLDPRRIQLLSLVLHELATNAAKYGSLSVSGGKVIAGYAKHGDEELGLTWREINGPRVTPPAATGYGTRLIQSTVTYSLGGTVELNYAATGLEATISIPIPKPVIHS